MPSNPNHGRHSSSNAVGPGLLHAEEITTDNNYDYTDWVNLTGVQAWSLFAKHMGGANLTNLAINVASGFDGQGIIKNYTVASGLIAGGAAWVDFRYWNAAPLQDAAMPKAIQFGFKTGGANATVLFHALGVMGL